jgi:predicted DNA-binding transcriptional regulator YafY
MNSAEIINEDEEWITAKVPFESENVAISEVLKYSPNVCVLQPVSVVSGVTKALSELLVLHGN